MWTCFNAKTLDGIDNLIAAVITISFIVFSSLLTVDQKKSIVLSSLVTAYKKKLSEKVKFLNLRQKIKAKIWKAGLSALIVWNLS